MKPWNWEKIMPLRHSDPKIILTQKSIRIFPGFSSKINLKQVIKF